MKIFALLLFLGAGAAVLPQDAPRKTPPKKQSAHAKATPEQIRKFNQLQKKQQPRPPGRQGSP
jgi:hypothetical protein